MNVRCHHCRRTIKKEGIHWFHSSGIGGCNNHFKYVNGSFSSPYHVDCYATPMLDVAAAVAEVDAMIVELGLL